MADEYLDAEFSNRSGFAGLVYGKLVCQQQRLLRPADAGDPQSCGDPLMPTWIAPDRHAPP